MTIKITDDNRAEIASIMNSVMVCLQILLAQKGIIAKLAQYTPEGQHINSHEQIIANIFDILTNARFVKFREHAATILDQHALFTARLAVVATLPASAAITTKQLIESIRAFNIDLMKDLLDLVANQSSEIKRACEEILKRLALSCNDGHIVCENTYNTYNTYHTYSTYECIKRDFLPALQVFKQRVSDSIDPINIMNSATGMIWNMGANAYATIGSFTLNIGSIRVAQKRERNEEEVARKKKKRRLTHTAS